MHDFFCFIKDLVILRENHCQIFHHFDNIIYYDLQKIIPSHIALSLLVESTGIASQIYNVRTYPGKVNEQARLDI